MSNNDRPSEGFKETLEALAAEVKRFGVPGRLALGSTGIGSISALFAFSGPTIDRGAAIAVAILCFSWTIHAALHLRQWTFDEERRYLLRLCRISLALAVTGLLVAVLEAIWPHAILQCVTTLLLVFAGWLINRLVYTEARKRRQTRSTEWVQAQHELRLEGGVPEEERANDWISRLVRFLMQDDATKVTSRCFTGAVLMMVSSLLLTFGAAARTYMPLGEGKPETTTPRATNPTNTPAVTPAATPTHVLPRTQPTLAASPPPQSYETYCKTTAKPGAGAPEPQSTDIATAWMNAGGFVAGCAGSVQHTDDSDVYYVAGTCGTENRLRAVVVADANGPAVLFLFDAARTVLNLAQHEGLKGASFARSGDGSLATIDTPTGTWGLIRPHIISGDAPPAPAAAPRNCEDVLDREAPYAVLPPAAFSLLANNASINGWSWPIAVTNHPGTRWNWNLRTGDGSPYDLRTGTIDCASQKRCVITQSDGTRSRGIPGQHVRLDGLLRYAPPPPSTG